MLNMVAIQGRIPTYEGAIKYSGEGDKLFAYGKISCQRNYKAKGAQYAESDNIDFQAWGATAKVIQERTAPGDVIILSGSIIVTPNKMSEDGKTVEKYGRPVVKVDSIQLAPRSESGASSTAQSSNNMFTGASAGGASPFAGANKPANSPFAGANKPANTGKASPFSKPAGSSPFNFAKK